MKNTEFIHEKSLQLLEKAGFRILHPGMVENFKKNGFKVDGNVVHFDRKKLMELVALAPGGFIMEARNKDWNLALDGTVVNYFPGYGCPSIAELDGTVRNATIDDYKTFLKIIEASDTFRINGGIDCQPQDLPPDLSWSGMAYMTILHSQKVILGQPGQGEQVQKIYDLAAIACGGLDKLKAASQVMIMMSTLSPLSIDNASVETCMLAAKYNQPLMVSPGPMAGATGPINLQANLVMGNAEILATVALIQLTSPGTPVMYGLQATTADMKTGGISIGSPGYALQAKYCKTMASFYGLPCRCGGTVNDAREVSIQSAYESFLPIFTTSQNKVELIVHACGILNSFNSMSYEKFMVDLEIISMVKYYLQDLEFNDQTVNLEIFEEVGPGGLFLNHRDTLKKCRKVPWVPQISHRGRLPSGVRLNEQLMENIHNMKDKLLSAYKVPELDPGLVKMMDEYMKKDGCDDNLLALLKP